jgi:hypothetical protein
MTVCSPGMNMVLLDVLVQTGNCEDSGCEDYGWEASIIEERSMYNREIQRYTTARADLHLHCRKSKIVPHFICHSATSQVNFVAEENQFVMHLRLSTLYQHIQPMPNMRVKNATQHPGNKEVPKRKRRTKEEMRIFREEEAALEAAKALKKQEAINRVAALEKTIAEGDGDMKTPQPRLRTDPQSRLPTLTESSDGFGPVSDSMDEYAPSAMDGTMDGANTTLSADEETPVKKKARTAKPSFRDAVKKVNEDPAQVKGINRTYASADLASPRDNNAAAVPKK